MAFDITPYVDMSPKKVRELIRKGVIDFPTAGMCRGYAQANLVILPPEYAADFEEFAHKNPFPCPILEIIKGTPETHDRVRAEISARISRNTGFMKTVYLQKKLLTLPSIGKRDMLDFLSAVLSHLKKH